MFDLRDFITRSVFQELHPGVKRDLPLSGTGTYSQEVVAAWQDCR